MLRTIVGKARRVNTLANVRAFGTVPPPASPGMLHEVSRLNRPLSESDPDLHKIIEDEKVLRFWHIDCSDR